ncbi:carbohydrate ABC transporter permease [Planctomycetota bacterium]
MRRGRKLKSVLGRLATYGTLIVLSLASLLPFIWLVRSSLCGDKEIMLPVTKVSGIVPSEMHPENYVRVFQSVPFWRYLFNTSFIIVFVVIGTVLSSSLCAYAFAFCRVPYRNLVFYGVLATLMLPGVVMIIPTFILFRTIGWIDTFKPLILPAFFGQAFFIFLFRQFFLSLPRELVEAARIDGASTLQIYGLIIMPLTRPAIVTVALFAFTMTWNDFMGPLIYLNSQENWTLQLGLQSFQGQISNEWSLLMAATVITVLPLILLFLFLQRYFIRGIALTGLKG